MHTQFLIILIFFCLVGCQGAADEDVGKAAKPEVPTIRLPELQIDTSEGWKLEFEKPLSISYETKGPVSQNVEIIMPLRIDGKVNEMPRKFVFMFNLYKGAALVGGGFLHTKQDPGGAYIAVGEVPGPPVTGKLKVEIFESVWNDIVKIFGEMTVTD